MTTLTEVLPSATILRRAAHRRLLVVLGLFALLVAVAVVSIGIGAVRIDLGRILRALAGTGTIADHRIVIGFRLPRIVVGLCVGASLAVSGVILQAVTRNPLASPAVVGVNGGAGLAALLVLSFAGSAAAIWEVPAAAFGGAAVAGGTTYLLSRRDGIVNPGRLALIGVAFGGFSLALIQLIIVTTSFTGDVQAALRWLTGSLWGRTWIHVEQVAPWTLVLLPLAWLLSDQLNLLGLGDDVPRALGSRLERVKLGLLGIAIALAGSAVAVGGTIAFVGLLAPHLCRRLVGPGHRLLIPAAACVGALLVVVADALGRAILPPAEIPVGLFTAVLGAPYFLLQLRKGMRA
ncbi:FecCD family ABC transporter permease [Kribbella sp. GL6]|uniref:FecCD family ABC transporter permease n=1 Tax=Kribbella sp. GL6 TaxID=3419765 RepID=UPI003D040F43